jgi:hypothetical protein
MRLNRLLLLSLMLLAGSAGAITPINPALFQKPLKERHIPLARDPLNPEARPMLSCFYYPGLMIRQKYRGGIGAENLGIRRLSAGSRFPACTLRPGRHEHIVDGRNEWGGLFLGARYPFVLFYSDDGANGGEGFAVFNNHGKLLFDDLAGEIRAVELPNPQTTPRTLRLRYQRFYPAECSLMDADRLACWEKIRGLTGLTNPTPPDCTAAYQEMAGWMKGETLESLRSDPSVIVYEAVVTLDETGTVRSTVPVTATPVSCHPAD